MGLPHRADDRPRLRGAARTTLRRGLGAILHSSQRERLLHLLQDTLRGHPRSRSLSALAWHTGEILAHEDAALETNLAFGSKIYLYARDHGHRYMYFRGIWEEPTTRFLSSISRPGWTFIDVGANAGYYSLLAKSLGGDDADVHAFEPNPELFSLLARSAAETIGTPIHVSEMACGQRSEVATLHLSPDAGNSGLSTLRAGVLENPETVAVTVTSLDDYCAERAVVPSVIKIDVEGHEVSVLQGAESLLRDQVPEYVISELEPARAPFEPLRDLLASHGYNAHSISATGNLVPFEQRYFQNLVFTRPRS